MGDGTWTAWRQIWTSTANLLSATGQVTIDVDNKQTGALRILANQTNPNNDSYFAQEIESTLSGSGATTGDREQGGLWVNVDSTATGGDTNNEHRAYGIYVDLDSTGDLDNVYGITLDATATPLLAQHQRLLAFMVVPKITVVLAILPTFMEYVVLRYLIIAPRMLTVHGGHFKVQPQSDTGNIGGAYGVYAEIEIPDTTGDHFGDSYVFRAVFDDNDGVVANKQYFTCSTETTKALSQLTLTAFTLLMQVLRTTLLAILVWGSSVQRRNFTFLAT